MPKIFGTPEIINFPFGANGKLIILGVSILMHITGSPTKHKRSNKFHLNKPTLQVILYFFIISRLQLA